MKDHIKYLRAFGILLLTALFLISCSSNNIDDFPFVTVGGSDDSEATEAETVYEYTKYRVIISRLASGELSNISRLLCEKIQENTGVYTTLCYDDEYSKGAEGEWAVFVGNVDIDRVKEVIRPMRSKDYICRSFEDKTLIGGKNDSATVTAVGRFIDEILPVSDAHRLIPEGGGFEYFGEYTVEGLYVEGVSIGDFDIVVEDDRDIPALRIAYALRDKISETFGFYLDVKHKKEAELGKNICIYTDSKCQVGRAELQYAENNIVLKAVDSTGLSKMTDTFFELLCSSGMSGELRVTIPKNLYSYYGDASFNENEQGATDHGVGQCKLVFTVMDILPEIDSPLALTELRETVTEYSSDLLLFGKGSGSDGEILEENFREYRNISDELGCAFVGSDIVCVRKAVDDKGDLLCDVFSVRCGEAEFLLVYISGSTEDDMVIDIAELTGETDLPTVAIVYTENIGNITLVDSCHSFFDKVSESSSDIYGKAVSYKCYADVSRVIISDENSDNKFGIEAINISVS